MAPMITRKKPASNTQAGCPNQAQIKLRDKIYLCPDSNALLSDGVDVSRDMAERERIQKLDEPFKRASEMPQALERAQVRSHSHQSLLTLTILREIRGQWRECHDPVKLQHSNHIQFLLLF